MPVPDQIKQQLAEVRRRDRIKTQKLASMDAFKEMIEIERVFGAIELGSKEVSPLKDPKAGKQDNQDAEESLWQIVARQFDCTEGRFQKFLTIIN